MYVLIQFFEILDFTCKWDSDCHQGYCEDETCQCLPEFQYEKDCSVKGCKCYMILSVLDCGFVLEHNPKF